MIDIIISVINLIFRLFIVIIVVDVIISYFMQPNHRLRYTLDRIIEPFLTPIRKIVPPIQMIDFSPIILLILVQIIEYLVVRILNSLR
jgi:YggT family protein